MRPEESREFTAQMERAAVELLKMGIYRKPDDLARRFSLPIPVVRYWWRNADEDVEEVNQSMLTPKEAKLIRRATQKLEGWEKVKRYRPACGAPLANGRKCKLSVAIRPPEGWDRGCLADRCRMHGGLSRRVRKVKKTSNEAEF